MPTSRSPAGKTSPRTEGCAIYKLTETEPPRAIDAARTTAGVEVLIPRGSIHYALLGGELVEADVDGLEVSVFVNEAGAPFPTPLAGPPEKVMIGLLREYADAVISGVTKVAETLGAPTRRQLRFGSAAHGLVGSSPWVFER